MKVLIVDDTQVVADTLAMILEMLGATPTIVNSGIDAISQVKLDPPDLAIVDMILETGMHGPEILLNLAKFSPNTKLIAASGSGNPAQMVAGLNIPALIDTIEKPFDLDDIQKCLKKINWPS